MELECKYQTKEDGSLYTENKYPEIVEELYKAKKLIMRIPEFGKREMLLDFICILEQELFSGNGAYFKHWLTLNRDMVEYFMDIFFGDEVKSVLMWGIKEKLEKVVA